MTENVQLKESEMMDYIRSLNDSDAAGILMRILNGRPDLVEEAYDAAMGMIDTVDADDVMNRVYGDLNILDYDDLNGRAGRTRYGYVDPVDAAWEMFEEQVEPYTEEMSRYQEHSLPDLAKIYCIGIIKGLMRYERESTSEIKDWMPDAPGDFISRVFKEWMKGKPSEEDAADVKKIMDGAE